MIKKGFRKKSAGRDTCRSYGAWGSTGVSGRAADSLCGGCGASRRSESSF